MISIPRKFVETKHIEWLVVRALKEFLKSNSNKKECFHATITVSKILQKNVEINYNLKLDEIEEKIGDGKNG